MELYGLKDLEMSKTKIPPLVEKIDNIKLDVLEPTRAEIMKITKVVIDFVKEKKRKIYGGYAQNKLVSKADPTDAFYKEDVIPDVDFYSPNPIVDLNEICNLFFKLGFKNIEGKEAWHKETYSVFINRVNACDITYVPNNVYHKMPYVEINEMYYASASFTIIDIYRMLNEPYFSSFRWEKTFPRLYLLQKHYPFNKATLPLKDQDSISRVPYKNDIKLLLQGVFNFIKNNKSVIVYSRYAYNKFLQQSGILKSGGKDSSKYSVLDIPYYEFVSINYKDDVAKLLSQLKSKFSRFYQDIFVVEHYPFWQFIGYSTYIKYKNVVIAHIVHYNKKCTPIRKVTEDGATVQIAPFDYTLMMSMITAFRMRVLKDKERYHYYNIMTSHLIEIRNYFMRKNNKTMFDDTLFQEFIPSCIGETIDPLRETSMVREARWLANEMVFYKYKPEVKFREDTSTTYRFPNSSGNAINNNKNYRISDAPRLEEGRRVESGEVLEPDEGPEAILDVKDLKEVEKKIEKKKKK